MNASVQPASYFDSDVSSDREITMPAQQRQAVDAFFEEANYESGIRTLDRLRSQRYMPGISHIRQLIYTALYPPETVIEVPITASPRKLQQQRQKQALMPSEAATEQAIELLSAFIRTNGPNALFQAIPCVYQDSARKGVAFADAAVVDDSINDEMKDSPIGRGARSIGQVRDCWGLLEPNLVQRDGAVQDEDSDDEEPMNTTVGRYSWPMLEILVSALEDDQRNHSNEAERGYSPILVSQVSRVVKPQPWNIERPLKVVFSSLLPDVDSPGQPFDSHHAELGIRLLSLLIDTTLANSRFVPTRLVQLSVTNIRQIDFGVRRLQYLLSSLSPRHDAFTLALICGFLEGSVVVHGQRSDGTTKAPTPRAKPRPRIAGRGGDDATEQSSSSSGSADPYPIPSLDTILRHLASSSVRPRFSVSSSSAASSNASLTDERLEMEAQKSAIAKMHLMQALERLMSRPPSADNAVAPAGPLTPPEWRDAIRTKKIRKAVETGFSHTIGLSDASVFKSTFVALCLSVVDDLEGSTT